MRSPPVGSDGKLILKLQLNIRSRLQRAFIEVNMYIARH